MSDNPSYWVLTLFSFLFGSCIGSFLNVCIYRIPRELSVVRPRSACPHCGHMIAFYDNIPLVSFFALNAKCRHCGGRISTRYVLVEFLVAVLFLLVWLKIGFDGGTRPLGLAPVSDWRLAPVYWLFVSGLTLGTFVDFSHMIIPDRVTLGGIIAGLLLSVLIPSLHGASTWLQGMIGSLIGAAVGAGLLWTVAVVGTAIFRKNAMGMGDVKLLGAIGAFLGWRAVIFTVVISSFVGSIVGITLVLSGRKKMQSKIPYGPYLALGAVLWILWGSQWWKAYFNLLWIAPL